MFTVTKAAIWPVLCLFTAFLAGWQAANWHNDSISLALNELAEDVKNDIEKSHAGAAEQLETKLRELRANERHFETTIQTEIIKPVFKNVCVSDEFVRLYNAAADNAERSLSGKHVNAVRNDAAETQK